MTPKDLEVALRKQRLLMRSSQLRNTFSQQAHVLRPVATTVDKMRAAVAWVRAHPGTVFGTMLAIGFLRPRAALRWGRRGFVAWQMLRRLQARGDEASPG